MKPTILHLVNEHMNDTLSHTQKNIPKNLTKKNAIYIILCHTTLFDKKNIKESSFIPIISFNLMQKFTTIVNFTISVNF